MGCYFLIYLTQCQPQMLNFVVLFCLFFLLGYLKILSQISQVWFLAIGMFNFQPLKLYCHYCFCNEVVKKIMHFSNCEVNLFS